MMPPNHCKKGRVWMNENERHTVDGSEIRHSPSWYMVVYTHYLRRVLYIPGSAGFLPSTVLLHISSASKGLEMLRLDINSRMELDGKCVALHDDSSQSKNCCN